MWEPLWLPATFCNRTCSSSWKDILQPCPLSHSTEFSLPMEDEQAVCFRSFERASVLQRKGRRKAGLCYLLQWAFFSCPIHKKETVRSTRFPSVILIIYPSDSCASVSSLQSLSTRQNRWDFLNTKYEQNAAPDTCGHMDCNNIFALTISCKATGALSHIGQTKVLL